MKKLYTILVDKNEVEHVEEKLKEYHIEEDDKDITKTFTIQGFELVYFIIATNEEVFKDIVKHIGGFRIY